MPKHGGIYERIAGFKSILQRWHCQLLPFSYLDLSELGIFSYCSNFCGSKQVRKYLYKCTNNVAHVNLDDELSLRFWNLIENACSFTAQK